MTIGVELGKSDVFVKLAVRLSPLVEEAIRQGITIKEFERRLFEGCQFQSELSALFQLQGCSLLENG